MATAGRVIVSGKVYRGNQNGDRLDDLTDAIVSGSVEWNGDRTNGTAMTAGFVVDSPLAVNPLADYFVPVLSLTYEDGRPAVSKQMGLFSLDLPEETVRPYLHRGTLVGRDLTWNLANSVLTDTYNVAAGADPQTVLGDLCTGAGVSRYSFPASPRTIPAAKSWWPGRTRLEVANEIANGLGWYNLYAGMDGAVTSGPILDLSLRQPVVSIGMGDPIGDVEVVPTTTTLANVVAVVKENPSGAPIVSIQSNTDASSPTSIPRTGRSILRREAVSTITTQAEADALALAYLRDGGSYYQVLRAKVLPGSWVGPWEVADVAIVTDLGRDLSGRYHVRQWKVGFTPADAAIECELNRVVAF